jgi:hypothetical protein
MFALEKANFMANSIFGLAFQGGVGSNQPRAQLH